MNKIFVYIALFALVFPSTAYCFQFGNTTIESSSTYFSESMFAEVGVSPEAGDIVSITAYLDADGSGYDVLCGIYDTSNNLLGESEVVEVPTSPAWTTMDFASPVAVASGTTYWLACNADGSYNVTTRRASEASGGRYQGYAYTGSLPDPGSLNTNPFTYSIYVTSGEATSTPTSTSEYTLDYEPFAGGELERASIYMYNWTMLLLIIAVIYFLIFWIMIGLFFWIIAQIIRPIIKLIHGPDYF